MQVENVYVHCSHSLLAGYAVHGAVWSPPACLAPSKWCARRYPLILCFLCHSCLIFLYLTLYMVRKIQLVCPQILKNYALEAYVATYFWDGDYHFTINIWIFFWDGEYHFTEQKFTRTFYLPQFAENYYFTAQAMASGPASLQGKIIYLGGQPYMLQECSGSDVSLNQNTKTKTLALQIFERTADL